MAATGTFERQSEKYQRRAQLCTYLAGGLAGIALFGAGDVGNGLFSDVKPFYRAVFFTLAFSTGACLGMSYSGFQWAATVLRRLADDGVFRMTDPYDAVTYPAPMRTEFTYRIGSVLLCLTGAWLLVTAWIDVAAG
ncbi:MULTISPECIES: hypothetical protein [Kribbella]|uniref:Uncharacterized protein n=2 Tax=Kribbella TaxID=182639 RepID=A0A4R0IDI5_9ACTN|nr:MULTISPECIES: hypothetical protein [Kribbella]TCC30507.1 hypothetical protein E0H50_24170 [Kribbella sindirgiensis]TCC33215.1 hypothetical protein E0H92_34285 [Kribbella speibonae]